MRYLKISVVTVEHVVVDLDCNCRALVVVVAIVGGCIANIPVPIVGGCIARIPVPIMVSVEVNVTKLVNVEWVKRMGEVVDHGCCEWNLDS